MKQLTKSAIAAAMLAAVMVSVVVAQGPIRKRVEYNINTSYALRMGDYILPAGNYIVYQLNDNDPNVFALYRDTTASTPIAMIRTVRIDYMGDGYPKETEMLIVEDESDSPVSYPVLRGWNIPGMDGWEIVSVVARDHSVLTRID